VDGYTNNILVPVCVCFEVLVAGDTTGWTPQKMHFCPRHNEFFAHLLLPQPGAYQFKVRLGRS